MATAQLVRPRDDRWIAGVCAGLARRFDIPPLLARILFLFVPGPNVIIYIVLWIIMPEEDSPSAAPDVAEAPPAPPLPPLPPASGDE
jgi:phage shock protein C